MSDHVFVTGASGRVAASLIPRLVAAGHTVTGLARSEAKAQRVRAFGATCVVGELSHPTVMDEGLAGAGIVYHLAGGMRGAGIQTPDRIIRLGSLSLIDRLEHAPQVNAVVFASSCAVYGDQSGAAVEDGSPARPHTRYGASKAAAEEAFEQAHRRGMPVRIARLAAVYGAGFPFLLEDWIRSGRAWLPGDGTNSIPTIHVDDAVEALVRLGTQPTQHVHYNVADCDSITSHEFYTAVAQAIEGSAPRYWSPLVPRAASLAAARLNERIQSKVAMRPRFTPDAIRLMTASIKVRTDRLRDDLGMTWMYPTAQAGLDSILGVQQSRAGRP